MADPIDDKFKDPAFWDKVAERVRKVTQNTLIDRNQVTQVYDKDDAIPGDRIHADLEWKAKNDLTAAVKKGIKSAKEDRVGFILKDLQVRTQPGQEQGILIADLEHHPQQVPEVSLPAPTTQEQMWQMIAIRANEHNTGDTIPAQRLRAAVEWKAQQDLKAAEAAGNKQALEHPDLFVFNDIHKLASLEHAKDLPKVDEEYRSALGALGTKAKAAAPGMGAPQHTDDATPGSVPGGNGQQKTK